MSDIQLSVEVEEERDLVVREAEEVLIWTKEDAEVAAEVGKDIKALQKKIHEELDPLCERAFQAHKAMTAFRSKQLKPLEEAEKILKGKILKFTQEERRKAEELRLKQEEEIRRRNEEAALYKLEHGDAEGAQELFDAPVVAVPVEEEKLVGATVAVRYEVTVTDMIKLAAAVADKRLPPGIILKIDEMLVKSLYRTAGPEFFKDTGISVENVGSVRL